jgi:phenylalanyl-tRNA synthetase alpha chain
MDNLFEQADQLLEDIKNTPIENQESLEQFRIRFLGSKGALKNLFSGMASLPSEQRKAFGQKANLIKQAAEERLQSLSELFSSENMQREPLPDHTAPGFPKTFGTRHPVSLTREQMTDIFTRIGFEVKEGPEIETDWYNFSSLNMPEDHPARDMQDTFYLSEDQSQLLRTHTSSVQIRVMEKHRPPIRAVFPGRVYRNETITARSLCTFHQLEGLYIDQEVSFADLKQTIYFFAQSMFGEKTEIRFRPSYFPFTEPSAEIDISCFVCGAKGCPVCKHSGWVEIGGCGMVDPAVMTNCGIDPEKYSGFAFGMGVERITMLKYQVSDIRLFLENDIRFLEQFRTA